MPLETESAPVIYMCVSAVMILPLDLPPPNQASQRSRRMRSVANGRTSDPVHALFRECFRSRHRAGRVARPEGIALPERVSFLHPERLKEAS